MAKKVTEPRFFVDEDDLALAKALDTARRDVVHPGHQSLPEVPKGTDDQVWMPIVAERGLVVLSRDRKIRQRPAELDAFKRHRLRAFFLTGQTSQSTWASLSILVKRWERIEEIIKERPDGPWAYSAANSAGLRELSI